MDSFKQSINFYFAHSSEHFIDSAFSIVSWQKLCHYENELSLLIIQLHFIFGKAFQFWNHAPRECEESIAQHVSNFQFHQVFLHLSDWAQSFKT